MTMRQIRVKTDGRVALYDRLFAALAEVTKPQEALDLFVKATHKDVGPRLMCGWRRMVWPGAGTVLRAYTPMMAWNMSIMGIGEPILIACLYIRGACSPR